MSSKPFEKQDLKIDDVNFYSKEKKMKEDQLKIS